MAVFRVKKDKNYTTMSQYHFKDKRLSWKAKGILSTMLSLPEKWDYSIAGLCALSSDGNGTTQTALKELESLGYLERRKIRIKGKIVDWEYIIYEKPQNSPLTDFPQLEKPHVEKPHVEKPHVEKPHVENPPQYNIKELSIKELSIKEYSNEFAKLWAQYPRKEGKAQAEKSYIAARKAGTTFEEVEAGVKAYANQVKSMGTEQRYIKHGSTWFNQKGWLDEYKTAVDEKSERSFDLDEAVRKATASGAKYLKKQEDNT